MADIIYIYIYIYEKTCNNKQITLADNPKFYILNKQLILDYL